MTRGEQSRAWGLLRKAAPVLAPFLLFAGISAFVQFQPSFRDPDTYYHIKMSQLIAEHGIVRTFPWLPFTSLAARFADQHFLYHALVLPFLVVLGPLMGMKAASVAFAAAAMTAFVRLLETYAVRHAWAYGVVLATWGSFMSRLNLAKAPALFLVAV